MKANKIPKKYETCDWLWNYGVIGLTKEHVKRLNNAINILESLNEHTDAKYLKEIKDKLLEDTPEPKIVKINTDAFIEKAARYLNRRLYDRVEVVNFGTTLESIMLKEEFVDEFRKYMKGE